MECKNVVPIKSSQVQEEAKHQPEQEIGPQSPVKNSSDWSDQSVQASS